MNSKRALILTQTEKVRVNITALKKFESVPSRRRMNV